MARLYKSEPDAATAVLDIGVTIALLGKDIFRHLHGSAFI
jgi:hypothetical protein